MAFNGPLSLQAGAGGAGAAAQEVGGEIAAAAEPLPPGRSLAATTEGTASLSSALDLSNSSTGSFRSGAGDALQIGQQLPAAAAHDCTSTIALSPDISPNHLSAQLSPFALVAPAEPSKACSQRSSSGAQAGQQQQQQQQLPDPVPGGHQPGHLSGPGLAAAQLQALGALGALPADPLKPAQLAAESLLSPATVPAGVLPPAATPGMGLASAPAAALAGTAVAPASQLLAAQLAAQAPLSPLLTQQLQPPQGLVSAPAATSVAAPAVPTTQAFPAGAVPLAAVDTASVQAAVQPQLAQALVAVKQYESQKRQEAQTAAAAYHAASSEAAGATSMAQLAQAAEAAQQASAALTAAAGEVAAAQAAADHLMEAVGAPPSPTEDAGQAAMPAAVLPASISTTAALTTAAMAAASQQTNPLAKISPTAPLHVSPPTTLAASAATVPLAVPNATPLAAAAAPVAPVSHASQLAAAAVHLQQTAVQKVAEQQAAAAAYHVAATEAATAASPAQQAAANTAAQQAAAAFVGAGTEAAAAANQAAQLQQAAAALVATAATPAPLVPLASAAPAVALSPTLQQPLLAPAAVSAPLPAQTAGLAAGLPPPAAMYPAVSPLTASGIIPPVNLQTSTTVASLAQQPNTPVPVQAAAAPVRPPSPAGSLYASGGSAHSQPAVPTTGPLASASAAAAAAGGWVPPLAAHLAAGHGASGQQQAQAVQRGLSGGSLPGSPFAVASPTASGQACASGTSTGTTAAGMIKVVCSSGGSFIKLSTGGWEYDGGETRLLSIPREPSFQGLLDALERTTGPSSNDSSASNTRHYVTPWLKYRLPSDPGVWVDLLDDEDVAMMFEEWAEHVGASGRATSKLHLFVQWRPIVGDVASGGSSAEDRPPSGDGGGTSGGAGGGRKALRRDTSRPHLEQIAEGSEEGQLSSHGSQKQGQQHHGHGPSRLQELQGEGRAEGVARLQADASASPQHSTPATSDSEGSEEGPPTSNERRAGQAHGPRKHSRRQARQVRQQVVQIERLRSSVDLAGIVEKMEVIEPNNISLIRFLGSGGYGDVYLGKWHNCEVAVKCLNPSLFFSGGDLASVNIAAVTDLIREADMLGSLRHPNIVWVYGIVLPDTDDGKKNRKGKDVVAAIAGSMQRAGGGLLRPPALVCEFMAGGSLKSAISRRADIVAGALIRVVLALDAAKGMEYLHSKSIVHFDLKSGNLLLGYRDRRPICKVADFGLSKEKMQTYVSGVNSQRGTLPWTAPEIIRSPGAVTEKVDVFSFGVVMWELWTGQEPFQGQNYHALLLQLADPSVRLRPALPGSPDWEGEDIPELAPGWQDLMERCWDEDPEVRPPFTEIIQELRVMVSKLKPRRSSSSSRSLGSQRTGSSDTTIPT